MDEFLNQTEPESLLPDSNPAANPVDEFERPSRADTGLEEARDLRKSEPVSDDVIELVQLLQSGLCQRLEHRLGARAHVRMKVRPVGLKTTTLSESFSDLLQSLLFFHDSNSPPSIPQLIDWQTPLAMVLIERQLGGKSRQDHGDWTDVLTDIETQLLTRLCNIVLDEFDLSPNLSRFRELRLIPIVSDQMLAESDFRHVRLLCVSFEIVFDHVCGMFRCWLPMRSQAPVHQVGGLSTQANLTPQFNSPNEDRQTRPVPQTRLELIAELATLKLRTSELAGLAVGDVLFTDVGQLNVATLRLANQNLYQAAVGTLAGKKAVRLLKRPNKNPDSASTGDLPQSD